MGLVEIVLAALCLNSTCQDALEDPVDVSAIVAKDLSERYNRLKSLERELKGQNLVVTTVSNENLSGTSEVNGTVIGTGVAFDLLKILQQKFEFTYTVVPPTDDIYSFHDMLKNGKANLSVGFLPVISNFREVAYSTPLDRGEWFVLMNRPKESATGSGLLAPFDLPVWILILLSLVVVGPVIYFVIYIQTKLCKDDQNPLFPLPACIWFVYGALLKQGSTLNPVTDSSRILFATWWIFITILTAFYTANLTAFLTLSKFTLPISKPEDIGAKKTKWVTTQGNALQFALSLNDRSLGGNNENLTNSNYYKKLAHALGKPYVYTRQDDNVTLDEFVKRKSMLFIREKPIVEYVMYNDYKAKIKAGIEEAERCTYIITDFKVATFSRSFAYAMDFKYKELLDSAIQYLVESGIVQYKLREKLPDTKICPHNLGNKERQLRNADLMMTYIIVGGGFVLSAIIFAVEMVLRHHSKQKGRAKKRVDAWMDNGRRLGGKDRFGENGKFPSPPPPYHTLFTPTLHNGNVKKRNINGRDYWVYDSAEGQKIIPTRAPSALLFQYTH